MNAIVIYSSKRGSTEKYAKWIAEDLGCETVPFAQIKSVNLYMYDVVIYGGWIRGSGIVDFDVFKKKWLTDDLMGKLIVYGVGVANATPENYMQVYDINYKGIAIEGAKNPTLYILSGAYDPVRITGMDKMLMGVMKKVLISGAKGAGGSASSEAAELADRLENGIDLVKRENVAAIVKEAVKMAEV